MLLHSNKSIQVSGLDLMNRFRARNRYRVQWFPLGHLPRGSRRVSAIVTMSCFVRGRFICTTSLREKDEDEKGRLERGNGSCKHQCPEESLWNGLTAEKCRAHRIRALAQPWQGATNRTWRVSSRPGEEVKVQILLPRHCSPGRHC